MGTEVEHASGDMQMNITTPSSTISTSVPKMSMFGKKTGFVIPKNKLSGSLVPIYRGTSKKGDADSTNEDSSNQVLRKTKWGPDLTLDTTVRKGKALAYQTRIDQISQQLTLGTLEPEGNDDSLSASDHQLSNEESELLELEKREIIGELLKLNPTFKAPADFKPILKEAKVPIPIKEYPGYNFIGLVFGPANDTQKRLEKETGAKIQVFGTQSDMGGKVEIIPTDGIEVDNAYEDLYVHVSADTFEKIDAAVALVELLLTRVSVNTVSSSTTSISAFDNNVNTRQNTPNSIIGIAPINQGQTQPYPRSQGQLPQYHQPWFHANPTHALPYLQSPANSTEPLPSNTDQVSSSPSFFGARPIMAASFSPVLQNPSVFTPRPQNALQPQYMQQVPQLGQTGGPRNTPGPSLTGPPYNVRANFSASAVTQPIVSRAPPVNIPNNMIGLPTIQPSSIGPARPAMPQAIRAPSPNPSSSIFVNAHSFDLRPQQPSSSDFTFQPHHRPWQGNQPSHHNVRHPVQPGPGPLSPQPPMLRPAMGKLNPLAVQNFPRLQINHQMVPVPSRHPILLTGPHMQPRNIIPPQHINNPSGPFHPRSGPQMHIPENHFRPPQQRFLSPSQHFGNHQPRQPFFSSSGGPQVYDPFSPTSVPFNPQMGGQARAQNESDPEYDDLMASVGVQ